MVTCGFVDYCAVVICQVSGVFWVGVALLSSFVFAILWICRWYLIWVVSYGLMFLLSLVLLADLV